MAKKITFTKLGTVKSEDFEYTYEDFILTLSKAIQRNYASNGVKCIDQDDSHGSYEVKLNNTIYYVNVPSKLIEAFNKLVVETETQKVLSTKEKQKKQDEQNKDNLAIANGKTGIFNNNDDKKRYINYLKSLLEDKISLKHSILGGLTSIAKPVLTVLPFIPFLACLIIGIIGIIGEVFGSIIGISGPVLSAISAASIFWAMATGVGNYHLVKRLLKYETKNGIYGISNYLDQIKEKIMIKKKIRALEKTLRNSKHNVKQNIEEIKETQQEEKEETKETLTPVEHSIKEVSKEIKQLKNIILKVGNGEEKKDYSKELLEIVSYYKEASKSFEDKGNYLLVHNQVLNQIYSLRFRVEQTIRDEKNREKTDNEFNTMLDEIDKAGKKSTNRK